MIYVFEIISVILNMEYNTFESEMLKFEKRDIRYLNLNYAYYGILNRFYPFG